MQINVALSAVEQDRATRASQLAAVEEARVTKMRELSKNITKDMDLFDRKGHELPEDQRTAAQARVKENLAQFQKEFFGSQKWSAADWFQFDTLKRKMQETMAGSVTNTEVRKLWAAPDALAKLNQQITQGLGTVRVQLKPFLPPGTDMKGKSWDELDTTAQQHIAQQAAAQKELQTGDNARKDALAQIASRQAEITANMKVQQEVAGTWQATKMGLNALTDTLFGRQGGGVGAAVGRFREINELVQQMRQHPMEINAKGLDDLTAKMAALKANKPWSLDLNMASTDANLKTLKEMFDYAEKIRGIQSKTPHPVQQMQRVKRAWSARERPR